MNNEQLKLKGTVTVYKNDQIIEEDHNSINTALNLFVRNCMETNTINVSQSMGINGYFESQSSNPPTEGKDGIFLINNSGSILETSSSLYETGLYYHTWKGVHISSGSNFMLSASMGVNYENASSSFNVGYADYIFASAVPLENTDQLTIYWKIQTNS